MCRTHQKCSILNLHGFCGTRVLCKTLIEERNRQRCPQSLRELLVHFRGNRAMCWFVRQEENLALLQDILSGGHHLPSPEYTIPKEASFLPVNAKGGMQRACNYRDAKCYLLGSCMEVEAPVQQGPHCGIWLWPLAQLYWSMKGLFLQKRHL